RDGVGRRLDAEASRSWTYIAAEAAAIATGSLLGYSWLLTSPSYNWITNWSLSVSAAALLVAFAIGEADRAASIWLGILGVALAAMFFSKFTAAVAAGSVYVAVILAWPLAPFRVRARWLAAAAAGFAIAALLYFVLLQSPSAWFSMFRLGVWSAATQSPLHKAGAMTRYYVEWRDDVVIEWLKVFGRAFYALTALALVIRFVPARGWAGLGLRAIAWAGIGYAGYLAAIHVRDYPPVIYHYDVTRLFFGWLLLLGPLALAWRGWRPETRPRRIALAWTLVVLMLFALPFCGAVGPGNPLQYGMRYTLAPWFALLALVLGRVSAPARTRWAVPAGLAALSAYCLVYLVKGPLEAPYRLLASVRDQTVDTQIG